MLLQLASWPEVETYLERSKAIVIPIGSTEQHGPTGLLGTDALCPEFIAHRAQEKADMLVGPTFNVGCAQHHLAFPGSMTLRPSTMIAAMYDWSASLARHGFDRIYWFNGHGGNVSTIRAAFAEIYADQSLSLAAGNRRPVQCRLMNWWDYKPVMDFCRSEYGAAHGSHATPSEISVTLHAYPQSAKQAEVTPKIAPSGPYSDAEDYRSKFPDGRMGSDPTLASAEAGEKLVALSSAGLIEDFAAFAKS